MGCFVSGSPRAGRHVLGSPAPRPGWFWILGTMWTTEGLPGIACRDCARMVCRWQRDSCRSLGGWGYIGGYPEMPLSRKGGWKHSDPPIQGGQSRGDLGCCRRSCGVRWGSAEQMLLLCWAPEAGTADGRACIYGRGNGLCFSHPSLGLSYLLARFDKLMASC